MDQLLLHLTQASPWVQLPLLLVVLVPLVALGAVGLLRTIDWVGWKIQG